jgi:hypothetical protein
MIFKIFTIHGHESGNGRVLRRLLKLPDVTLIQISFSCHRAVVHACPSGVCYTYIYDALCL